MIFQECIVVCVISLEEVEISPNTVPFNQCREIRTEGVGGSKRLDNIIIPAATAIVVCVIVAVIIFIFCLKSSNKKTKKLLDEKPIPELVRKSPDVNPATEHIHEGPVTVYLFKLDGEVIICAPDVQKVVQANFHQGATVGKCHFVAAS